MTSDEINQLIDILRSCTNAMPKGVDIKAIHKRLVEIGPDALPSLLELFEHPLEDSFFLWFVAPILGDIGDKRAIPVLVKALRELAYGIPGDDIALQVSLALRKLGPDSIPVLTEMFLGDDEYLCFRARDALEGLGDAALQAIIPHINTDTLIHRSAHLIGGIKDPNALPTMLKLLVHLSPEIRVYAIVGVLSCTRGLSSGQITQYLMVLLKDPEEWVRENAIDHIFMVSQPGDPTHPELVAALSDRNERVAKDAEDTLKKIGTPEALQALAEWQVKKGR